MPIPPYIPGDNIFKCEVLIAGNNNGLDSLLLEAQINFELNKIPSARFSFAASNFDLQSKEKLPSDNIKEDDEITFNVFAGKEKKTLFKGIVKSVEKNQKFNKTFVKIECKDKAFKLTFPSAEAETNEQTFDDKLELFAAGLTIGSSLTGQEWGSEKITHNPAIVPWDFILSYLDSVGMMMAVRNGELNGVDILTETTEKYYAENGINIFSFSGKSDDSKKINKASIDYWDPASQSMQVNEAEQEAPYPITKLIRLNENRFSQGTITRILNATLKKSSIRCASGTVRTFGNMEAFAGDYIICNKVNEKLDNKPFLITAERHVVENGVWRTEYAFGLEAESSFAETASRQYSNAQVSMGQSNMISGLLIGVVVQIEEDPLNEFRIKVRIPALAESGEGVWARLATLNASTEMGSFFIPNVDDEVLLGCLGNNPDTPVILGSLYSSAHKPPFEITADNFFKGFVTKEGSKIVLDDEKKVIELSTKKGNKLLITDDQKGFVLEDENKNKIVMNQDGITIESSKDLIFKAKGNIKADGAEIKAKASGNLELKGSMIKIN